MPFDWTEIESKWLFKARSLVPKEDIIASFNKVRNRFSEDFFNNYSFYRCEYITALILDLAKILDEVEKGNCILPKNGEIVQRIKENQVYLTRLIIQLAAYFLRHGLIVEFEPELNGRKPDLRVKFNDEWIYIEESKLYTSNRFNAIYKIMDTISNVIETINSDINISVILLKEELTAQEIKEIVNSIRNLCNACQPQELKIENLVRINTYNNWQEKPTIDDNRPALCSECMLVGGGFERHLHIEIQFSDVRINKILKKAKQLSSDKQNLIILDITLPGNLKKWIEPTQRILNNHTRIGAILLIEEHHFIKSLEVDSGIILNPCSSKPLPKDFLQLVNNCLKERSNLQLFP